MSEHKVSDSELIEFAHRVYEEACCGYLDLKESICNKLVQELLYQNYKKNCVIAPDCFKPSTFSTSNNTLDPAVDILLRSENYVRDYFGITSRAN